MLTILQLRMIVYEVAICSFSSSSEDSEGETHVMGQGQLDNATITTDSSQLLYHATLTLKDIIYKTAKTSKL